VLRLVVVLGSIFDGRRVELHGEEVMELNESRRDLEIGHRYIAH
jgi:hypothetical protein